MNEDVEIQLPKRKKTAAKSQTVHVPYPVENRQPITVKVDQMEGLINPMIKLVADLNGFLERMPETQRIRGTVDLSDNKVEIDLTEVLTALNRIEESVREDASVTVKNQTKPADTSKQITELKVAFEDAIKNAPVPQVNIKQSDTTKTKITNQKPSEAIPVTLTDKAQKSFMEAVTKVVTNTSGGSGFPSQIAVTNPDGSLIGGSSGGITDTQLRATPVPVDVSDTSFAATQSGTWTVQPGNTANTTAWKVDGSAVTQPVSGTVTANAGTNLNTAALALEAGNLASIKTGTDKIPALGQATMANSSPVVISSNQGAVPVSGTFYQATQPVSLTSLPALAAGSAIVGSVKLTDGTDIASIRDLTNSDPLDVAIVDGAGTQITSFGGGTQYTEADVDTTITGTALMWEDASDTLRAVSVAKPLPVDITDSSLSVTGTFWQATQPVSAVSLPLPTGAATETTLGSVLTELGQKTEPANTQITKEVKAATPTQSSVSVLTSSTTVLASNANRLGATIYNESGAIVFLKLGATASATSYSVQVAIGGYYEIPFGYTGVIDGITALTTAVVRVTELAA